MSAVVDVVEDVVGGVADIVSDVGGALVGAVEWVVDDVIQPVVNTVGDVVQGALDNPLKTIAQIAAVVTKQYWLLPIIAGADVAIKGGDFGDIAKAVAISVVMQEVSQYAGEAAGGYASGAAETAGWSAANQKLAGEIIGAGAGGAAIAVVTGSDPLEAFLAGGVTAGASAVLGKVPGFKGFSESNKIAAKTIESMVMAKLSGGNVTSAMIGSLIATSGLVSDAIKEFDPLNGQEGAKLNAAQTAILTNVLTGTASAALTGGDPSRVVQAALMKAGSKALGEMATEGFKDATSSVSEYFNGAQGKADILDGNIAEQEEAYSNYKAYADPLNAMVAEQTRLKSVYDAAVVAHNANPTEASRNAANSAGDAFDAYVTKLNKDYAETYSPNIKKYGDQLDKLQQDYAVATGDYEKAMDAFADSTDRLSDVLDPIYLTSNRAFTEALDPNFNAEEYREINGLGDDVDVYEDYLNRGQLEGLATNNKDQAIIDAKAQVKAATGQDIPNYIIERALTVDNDKRDEVIKSYAETAIKDNQKFKDTQNAGIESVISAYEQAGYTQAEIAAKIDSGEFIGQYTNLLEGQKASVESLRQYVTDIANVKGTDSAEYNDAHKAAMSAMADYGGYGITKTGDTYTSAEYGELDSERLLPVSYNSDSGWYRDPVTGQAFYKVVVTGGTQQYLPASEIPEQEISAIWAIGNSANPPENGGGSYFGSGSGVSSGMFGGLKLVSVDDATGAKMYSDGTGMTLIAYADGKGKVINNKMEVELISPEELAKLMGEIPVVKPPTPADEVKDIADLTQPEDYDAANQDALDSAQTDIKNSYQTADEVKAALESLGYNATPEEIQKFTGEKTPDQLQIDVETYIDPLMVSREEVKAAYAEMGLSKPTEADIDRLVGQYEQAALEEKAAANLDAARYNTIQDQLGTQGRGPNQSDLDALTQMIGGTRPTDLSYDTNNDGRIDGSDLSFLTGIVNSPTGGSGFNAPSGSPWAATGLYGDLADAEAARAQDAANQKAAGEAAAAQAAATAAAAKAQAATNAKNAQIRGVGSSAAQAMQQFTGSAPTLMRQATEQVSTPIYGQAVEAFNFGEPLDVNWFNPSKEKQSSQTGSQTTKMASGGYLDSLLGEDMSVDDLLKLLR